MLSLPTGSINLYHSIGAIPLPPFKAILFSLVFSACQAGIASAQTAWTTECVADILGKRECKIEGDPNNYPEEVSGLPAHDEQAQIFRIYIEEGRVQVVFVSNPYQPTPEHELVLEIISGPDAPVSQTYRNACEWEDRTMFRYCSINDQNHRNAIDNLFRRNSVARIGIYTSFGWLEQRISLQGYTNASDRAHPEASDPAGAEASNFIGLRFRNYREAGD